MTHKRGHFLDYFVQAVPQQHKHTAEASVSAAYLLHTCKKFDVGTRVQSSAS